MWYKIGMGSLALFWDLTLLTPNDSTQIDCNKSAICGKICE